MSDFSCSSNGSTIGVAARHVLGMLLALVLVLGLCPVVPAQAQPISNNDSIQTQASSAVTLQLLDGDTGAGIADAQFQLQHYNTVTSSYDPVGTYVTNAQGIISVSTLAEGTYRFAQSSYPAPYNTWTGSPSFVVDGSGAAISQKVYGYARYTSTLTLTDDMSGLPIANARFTLQRFVEGAWQPYGAAAYTTDFSGVVSSSSLPQGTYQWVQVAQTINPTGAQYYYQVTDERFFPFEITRANAPVAAKDTALVDVTLAINWRETGDASASRPSTTTTTLYADGVRVGSKDVSTGIGQGTTQNVEWAAQKYWAAGGTTARKFTAGESASTGNIFDYTKVPGNTSQFNLTIDNMYPSYKKINVNTFTKDWLTIPQDVRTTMAPDTGTSTITVVAKKDSEPLTDRTVNLEVDPLSGGCMNSGVISEEGSNEFVGKTITFDQTLPSSLQNKFISTQEITLNEEGVPNMVNITNIYATNSLTIRNIKNDGSATPPDAMASITYTVVLSDTATSFETIDEKGNTGTFKSGDTITVPFGSWVSILKISDGATYTATQQDAPGYTCTNPTSLVNTGTISVNQGSNAAFNNTFTAASTTFTPGVSKTVNGPEATSATFDFTLTAVGDAPMPAEGGEVCSVTTDSTATANFGTITYDVPGVYTYVIAEKQGTAPQYTYDAQQVTLRVSVERTGTTVTATPVYTKNGQTVTPAVFTNTYSATTQVDGTITWTGVAADASLPGPTINLLRNGTSVDSSTLAAGATSFSFENLAKFDADGNPYTYTVEQQPIGGYDITLVGTDFTNAFNQGTTDVTATLKFDVPAGTVTPSVTLHVLQDGVTFKSSTVDAQHASVSFADLPEWKTDGTRYAYTLAVDPIDGYTTHVDGDVVTLTKNASEAKTLNTAASTAAKTGDTAPIVPMAMIAGALAIAGVAMRKRRLQ